MAGAADTLEITEVTPLPERVAVGGGTALFLDGRCAWPGHEIAAVEVALGERFEPALGWGLAPPRMRGTDYWWAILPLDAGSAPAAAEARIAVTDAGGRRIEAVLGAIELTEAVPSPEPPVEVPAEQAGADALVAICMATFEPDPELFAAQIESIRGQTHGAWICLISDDGSAPATLERMREILAGDPRFVLSESPGNRGFYANFERALAMVPAAARFVALSDQDDRWRADKLERLLAGLAPDAGLVYSDMRITGPGDEVLAETYWGFRRNNHEDFGSLVLANTVTGAACLFRAELLADVLPFPPRHGAAFHDHWIAQVALALGPISYVDEPLYDYVQHDAAALGYLQANGFGRYSAPLRERIGIWYGRWSGRGFRLGWRVPYFRLYCRVRIATTALRLRLAGRLGPERLAVLESIADTPSGLAWLTRRGLRDLRGPTETIGRERVMLAGLAWRRGAEARKRARRLGSRLRG